MGGPIGRSQHLAAVRNAAPTPNLASYASPAGQRRDVHVHKGGHVVAVSNDVQSAGHLQGRGHGLRFCDERVVVTLLLEIIVKPLRKALHPRARGDGATSSHGAAQPRRRFAAAPLYLYRHVVEVSRQNPFAGVTKDANREGLREHVVKPVRAVPMLL